MVAVLDIYVGHCFPPGIKVKLELAKHQINLFFVLDLPVCYGLQLNFPRAHIIVPS